MYIMCLGTTRNNLYGHQPSPLSVVLEKWKLSVSFQFLLSATQPSECRKTLSGLCQVKRKMAEEHCLSLVSRLLLICILIAPISSLLPVVRVGPFEVMGCDNPSINRLSDVREVVQDVILGAVQAAEDAKLGTASLYGYSELMKSNANRAEVIKVFGLIASGATVNAPDKSGVLRPWPVGFVCPSPDEPLTAAIHQLCLERNLMGYTMEENPMVVLCPGLWSTSFVLPQRKYCPRRRRSTFSSDRWFQFNRFLIVMHELVHLYVPENLRPEIFEINEMVALNQSDSVKNINNLALYASSKSQAFGRNAIRIR